MTMTLQLKSPIYIDSRHIHQNINNFSVKVKPKPDLNYKINQQKIRITQTKQKM